MPLRYYQEDAIRRVDEAVTRGVRKPVIVLPTGAGKTVTFVEYALRRGGRTLILAHKDDLIQQAFEKIVKAKPDARVGVVKAEKNQCHAPFVLASIQTLSKEKRLAKIPTDFSTIIIDECHRAASPSYKKVIEHFADVPVILGVTATPERADGIGLDSVFNEIAYGERPEDANLISLIREGYLAMPVGRRVKLDIDFRGVHTKRGDFDASEIKELLDAANWHHHVTKAWLEHAQGRLTVGFVGRIEQAELVTAYMKEQGIRACCVHGKQSKEQQKRLVEAFSRGMFDVMWTVDLMIEGSDIPPINCILMARPTKSRRIYAQAVGRGLRLSPETGKEDCLILDIVGATETHDLVTLADIAGVDKIKNGESFLEAQARDEAEKELLAQQAAEEAEKAAEEAAKAEAEHVAYDVDLLNSQAEVERVQAKGFQWKIDRARREAWLWTGKASFRIHRQGDVYYGEQLEYGSERRFWKSLCDNPDYNEVRRCCEDAAKALIFNDPSAKWREQPATENQLKMLARFRIPTGDGLTKGQASVLLQERLAKKVKKEKLQLQ